MSEPTCTESAPCFACARCVQTMANVLRDDPNMRAHMTGIETRSAWKPAWKHAAEAGGTLRGDGSDGSITIKSEAGAVHVDRPHIATLPTDERIELPAGTVLREATAEDATRAKLRAARRRLADAGDRRDGDACDEAEREIEQLEKVLADLTERVGLPREMAPSATANGNAETCGAVAGPTTCANRQWLAGSRVCSRAPHVGGAHKMDRYGDAWYSSPDDPRT